MTQANPRTGAKAVFQVVCGNFLEMYDFMVFGFYAHEIGATFFPGKSPFASLMLAFASFGVGFLMRPLGALVLGAYIDRHGRRQGLMLTLGLMASGIVLIALTPGYSVLGPLAPLLVLLGRLLQGFSAGAELGGVSVYLAEIAPPGRTGFYVSWQSASQQVAIVFAAVLGLALRHGLSGSQMASWGWRVPFLVGSLLVPLLLVIRRHLQETPAFAHRPPPPSMRVIMQSIRQHLRLIVAGTGLVAMTTVAFYLITAYMPTYGRETMHLGDLDSLWVTACIALSNFVLLPIMGACSDRVGRRPLLLLASALTLLLAWPLLSWATSAPSFARLLAVGEALSLLYSTYNGAMVVALTEWMPAEVRTTGFSLAYSLATATFGGFTPMISHALIEATSWPAAPALWLTLAAAVGLCASSLGFRGGPASGSPQPMAGKPPG